jgi:hypothetical protein
MVAPFPQQRHTAKVRGFAALVERSVPADGVDGFGTEAPLDLASRSIGGR